MVEFYASWCGYCQNLSPTFKELADEMASWQDVIQVAVIDCGEERNNQKRAWREQSRRGAHEDGNEEQCDRLHRRANQVLERREERFKLATVASHKCKRQQPQLQRLVAGKQPGDLCHFRKGRFLYWERGDFGNLEEERRSCS